MKEVSVTIKFKVEGPNIPSKDKIRVVLEKKYKGGPYVYEGWSLVQKGKVKVEHHDE